MALFNYTALKSGNDIVNGKIEAISLREARELLRNSNLIPTKIEEESLNKKETKLPNKSNKNDFSLIKMLKSFNEDFSNLFSANGSTTLKKLGMRDKIDFANSLYFLSRTGIPLIEALLFIESNSASKKVKLLCTDLRKHILSGHSFSDSLAKYPKIFDQIFAGLVKAGEESGELDTTLSRIVYLLEKEGSLRSKIIALLVYPCFIMLLALAVTLVMLTFVFPAFKNIYDQMGKSLPLITQIFMDISVFLKNNMIAIPIILASTAFSMYFLFVWPTSRKILDRIALKIPIIKTFIIYAALSNYLAVMKVSFDAGVTIVDSLYLANLTIKNYKLKEILKEIPTKLQGGESLSNSLKTTKIIPGILMCMIATGEQAGQLGELLTQATLYIDIQLDNIIDLIGKIFEPLLLIVIGIIVLLLALALYLPLFNTYSNMVS